MVVVVCVGRLLGADWDWCWEAGGVRFTLLGAVEKVTERVHEILEGEINESA
jgi:hypothetical protein